MENHQDFIIENGVLTKYSGPGGDVTIPEGVTQIGNRAFANCKSLTGVTIPEGVTEIGEGVFTGCESLTSVMIPAGVTEVGSFAFSGCASLTSVVIPENVKEIGIMAFGGCESLTGVTLLGRTEVLYKHCFLNIHPVLIAPHMPVSSFDAWNQPDACCGFARLYLEGAALDEEIRAGYLKYIEIQHGRLFSVAIRHEELLRLMLAEKMLAREDIDPLLEESDKQNNVAAKAAVLDYAGRNLKSVDPTTAWKL